MTMVTTEEKKTGKTRTPRQPREPRIERPKLEKPVGKRQERVKPEAAEKPKSTKPEKATEWAMGTFDVTRGVQVVLRGDHNAIEKASAKLNKQAGMRVAFVVDVRAVPVNLLLGTAVRLNEDEVDEEEEEEGEGEE